MVAFDADRGFQYGALLNIYNFGDGSLYPNPKSWWYIEASAYTGGTWNLYLNYDKRDIWENTRLSICTNYSNESALDFYGFNGYQSIYTYALNDFFKKNPNEFSFDDSKKGKKAFDKFDNGAGKAPNGFYRYSRQSFRAKADLTGEMLRTSSGKPDILSTGSTTRTSSHRAMHLLTIRSTISTRNGESLMILEKTSLFQQ